MVPQDVPSNRSPAARSTETWDPYDVWLKRVKQPRDRRPAQAVVLTTRVDAVAIERGVGDDSADPSLLLTRAS